MARKEKENEETRKKIERDGQEIVIEDRETREQKRERLETEERLANWIPRTQLGKEVMDGKIKDIDLIFEKNLRILEPEIIDFLVQGIESNLVNIGQAKGKFGGGKRRPWRQTQRKTKEGNVPTFACMTIVGDKKGHVGVGFGRAKETVPAKQKALRNAKQNLMLVKRGCGSFDCTCSEPHSIPFAIEGKCGSVRIKLIPAPKGTGLVIDDECKKLLRLAGIKDIYSRTFGQTRTKFNLIKACFIALQKLGRVV